MPKSLVGVVLHSCNRFRIMKPVFGVSGRSAYYTLCVYLVVYFSPRSVRYPDATEAELQSDDVCIICREQMAVGAGACKKLPCNHIFHASCLRSWFQRQQTCPTCRMEVRKQEIRGGRDERSALMRYSGLFLWAGSKFHWEGDATSSGPQAIFDKWTPISPNCLLGLIRKCC